MKKRRKRVGTFAYYIEEVVSYRTKCERDQDFKDRYPPVVVELLFSLLICIRPVCHALLFLIGALLMKVLTGS